jgi:type I restriction enzyme S subunit
LTPDGTRPRWREKKLGELFRLKHGYAFKGEYFAESGPYVLLTPGNFYDEGGFKQRGEQQKHYTGPVPRGFILKEGDLLVAMTEQAEGLLGSPAIIPESNKYLHNQRLGLITELNTREINKKFLYYLFNFRNVRAQIRGTASGVKVRHTSPERIYEVKVRIPDMNSQHKIAVFLSTYDDLIENNIRRIKILEEMAAAIYREWFVYFRFPGHEKVKMVDSSLGKIPERWEAKKLDNELELAYGKGLKADDRVQGTFPVYGSAGIVGYHNESLVRGPGIIVGRKGNVGTVFWSDEDFYPIDTVFYVRTKVCLHYIYYNLKGQNFINKDAAVPGLNRNQAYSLPFLLPSATVLNQFEFVVSPIFTQLRILRKENGNLRDTRDLLSPRLISGEVNVSELDAVEGNVGP